MTHSAAPLQAPIPGCESLAADRAPDICQAAFLAGEIGERYRVFADHRDPRRPLRYVAVARSLAIRPYAVVTSDPDELRRIAAGNADTSGRSCSGVSA
jgi:hypothetical protein